MPRAVPESGRQSSSYKRRTGSSESSPYFGTEVEGSPAAEAHSSLQSATPQGDGSKRKHICPTCDRAFSTSGHLARHSRIHSGERAHACPFPNCETRCSRQDNLQQHYRIHLSPGSRRTSTKTAVSRTRASKSKALPVVEAHPREPSPSAPLSRRESYVSATSTRSSSLSPGPSSSRGQPTREDSMDREDMPPQQYAVPPPPDSPPALTQAVLPSTRSSFSSSSSRNMSHSPVLLQRPGSEIQGGREASASPELGRSPVVLSHTPTYTQQYTSGPSSYAEESPRRNSSYQEPPGNYSYAAGSLVIGPGSASIPPRRASLNDAYVSTSPTSSRSSSISSSRRSLSHPHQHTPQHYSPVSYHEQVSVPNGYNASNGYDTGGTSSPSDSGLPPSPSHTGYPDTARIYQQEASVRYPDRRYHQEEQQDPYSTEYDNTYPTSSSSASSYQPQQTESWYGRGPTTRGMLSPVRELHHLPPMQSPVYAGEYGQAQGQISGYAYSHHG